MNRTPLRTLALSWAAALCVTILVPAGFVSAATIHIAYTGDLRGYQEPCG